MPCHANKLSCLCKKGLAGQGGFLEIMKTFEDIWRLLNPQGEYKRRRGACERLWQGYSEARQEEIYAIIEGKLQRGEFVNENPYFAIEDNARSVSRPQILSFDEYYARFHTTEEQGGWKRKYLPDQQKTIYVNYAECHSASKPQSL